MHILFNGLGPKDTVTHDGKIYKNGAFVDLPDDFAEAFIAAKLAVFASGAEADSLQKLESNNAARRVDILNKAKEALAQ